MSSDPWTIEWTVDTGRGVIYWPEQDPAITNWFDTATAWGWGHDE